MLLRCSAGRTMLLIWFRYSNIYSNLNFNPVAGFHIVSYLLFVNNIAQIARYGPARIYDRNVRFFR